MALPTVAIRPDLGTILRLIDLYRFVIFVN